MRYLCSFPGEEIPCGSAGKESACNVGDLGSIPGLGRSPGEGKGDPLQYSGLENSMSCIVHGVTKSWTRLSLSLSRRGKSLIVNGRVGLEPSFSPCSLHMELYFSVLCVPYPPCHPHPALKWCPSLHTGHTLSPRPHMALSWSLPTPREHITLAEMCSDRDQGPCRRVSWKIRPGEGPGSSRDRCCRSDSAGTWELPIYNWKQAGGAVACAKF